MHTDFGYHYHQKIFKYLFLYTIIQDNLGSLKYKTSFMDADKHAEDRK